jgi:hypothetical protein
MKNNKSSWLPTFMDRKINYFSSYPNLPPVSREKNVLHIHISYTDLRIDTDLFLHRL